MDENKEKTKTNKMKKSELKEMLNEGIIDTIKDKMVSMGKKLLNKFAPEELASMKAAAEKVLGPNYSKEDITLDKAKEIGKIISGGLDESQELDENLRKKIGATLLGLGLPTAFIAGHGFGHTDAGAITAGIGTIAAMIGMVMTIVDEAQEAPKSNKMKKSELKEMIKAAMLNETLVDADQDMADAILNALGGEEAFEALVRAMSTDDAQTYLGAIMRDHDIEMGGPVGDIPGFEGTMDALDSLSIREEKKEEKEEEEVEVEDEEIDVDLDQEEVDMDMDMDMEDGGKVGLTGDKKVVDDSLEAALEAARNLGDEKLVDQIGNTITFFTRSQIVRETINKEKLLQEVKRMQRIAGIIK
jgi:hypothetical protein